MKKMILIALIIAIIIISVIVYIRYFRKPTVTKEYLEQRFSQLRKAYQDKLAQGYDLTEVLNYGKQALEAYKREDYQIADRLLDKTFDALERAKIPPEPIKQCQICPLPSNWSDCVNNKQTRTDYKCDAETGYECQSYLEEKSCEIVAPANFTIFISNGMVYAKSAEEKIDFQGADATTVIQNAINTLRDTGGKIVIKNGLYIFSSRLNLVSNIILEGESWDAILKLRDNANTQVIYGESISNVVIKNLQIDGNKHHQTYTGTRQYHTGVWIRNSDSVTIENNFIHDILAGAGISFARTSNSKATRNTIKNNGFWEPFIMSDAIYQAGDYNEISYNYIEDVTDTGSANDRDGIVGSHAKVFGNTIKNALFAIQSYYGFQDLLIENNVAENSKNNHIYIIGTPSIARDIKIINNTFSKTFDGVGILLEAVEGGEITGNTIKNSKFRGIIINGTKYITIEDNRAYDDQIIKTQSYGIEERGQSDWNSIIRNDVRDNVYETIPIVGPNTIKMDNIPPGA